MLLILASNSPRRVEILNFFNIPFYQTSPQFDEESVPFAGDPEEYARLLAEGKAASLKKSLYNELVLTADTVVYKEGRLYPKSPNEKEAEATLRALAGGWHTVYTAVCAQHKGRIVTEVQATRVLLFPLDSLQIHRYHQALHWADKAGAYAIQGAGSLIVSSIEGCYYNVMGLPIEGTRRVLDAMGLNLWEYLRPVRTV